MSFHSFVMAVQGAAWTSARLNQRRPRSNDKGVSQVCAVVCTMFGRLRTNDPHIRASEKP